MNLRNLLTATLAVSFISATAQAQDMMKTDGLYIKADLGAAFVDDLDFGSANIGGTNVSGSASLDTGYMATIGIGKYLGQQFRVEGEVGHLKADADTGTISGGGTSASTPLNGEVSMFSFTLAAYVDLLEGGTFTPYIGAGLGAARWELEGSIPGIAGSLEEDGTDLTAFGELGAAYNVSDGMAFTIAYRYQKVDADIEATGQAMKAGIRYNF